MNETVIIFGDEVKALGNGKVAGRLVTFGDPKNADITRHKDFFTKETDYDADFTSEVRSTVYYHHGLDPKVGKQKLCDGVKATLTMDDIGIWAEAQLNMANKYEAVIYEMVANKKMGWSSGTVNHLVEREEINGAHWIKKWGIGLDASLTPIPADYRNKAVAIKSLESESDLKSIIEDEEIFVTGEGLSISRHIKSVLLQVEILGDRISDSIKIGAAINKQNTSALLTIADNLMKDAETIKGIVVKEDVEETVEQIAEQQKSLRDAELKALENAELEFLEMEFADFN